MDGDVVRLGGKHFDSPGYDLLGVMVGSEGMLGVVTEVTVRVLPKPPGARALMIGFATVEGAGDCVAAVIAAGIIPGGMEMMDRLAVEAAEAFVHAGYPLDADALLIVELDGCEAEVDHLVAAVEAIAGEHGATLLPRQPVRRGAAVVLGRAEGRVPGGRTNFSGLLLHGRHDPTQAHRRRPVAHEADGGALRPAGGQRVPRRRWQSPSADPL